MNDIIERIPLDKISPHPQNRPFGGFNEGKLAQLAESIKRIGVQQPAIVRKKGKGFELVAGERRWRASKIAEVDHLPCIVKDLTDAEALHIQLIENVQREDIHPLDEASGYDLLRREGGYDVELLAQEVGRTPAYIYQTLKLLSLIKPAQDLLREGQISKAVAVHLARLEPEEQETVLKEYLTFWRIKQGISAADLASYIERTILHQLSKAAWKLGDADLVPAAGACSACSKRTGANQALFEEFNPKKDQCLDPSCFASKQAAIVTQRKKDLKASEGLLVSDEWQPREKGALGREDWEECKKKDEGAVRVLVVDGPEAGKLTYGKRKKDLHTGKPSTNKEDRSRERKLDRTREALWGDILTDLLENAEICIEEGGADEELLRFAVSRIWKCSNNDEQRTTAKRMGWEKAENDYGYGTAGLAKIGEMGLGRLYSFLVVLALAPLGKPQNWGSKNIPAEFGEVAKILGLSCVEDRLAVAIEASGFTSEEISPTKEPKRWYEGAEEEEPEEDEG